MNEVKIIVSALKSVKRVKRVKRVKPVIHLPLNMKPIAMAKTAIFHANTSAAVC